MSTDANNPTPRGQQRASAPQGRHRAAVETRSMMRPAALPVLLGGAAVVLVGLVLAWQVL